MFVSRCVAYSVYDLSPLPVREGEIVAGDGQMQELPVSLSPHHLSGKLRGPRRVGVRQEHDFIHWGERRERNSEIRTCKDNY